MDKPPPIASSSRSLAPLSPERPPMSSASIPGYKTGHVCPVSTATHPSARWELAFVYCFIHRFCQSGTERWPIQGLLTPMDLEEALMSEGPHPILEQILVLFIKNLKFKRPPGGAITDSISHTLSMLLAEYLKLPERSCFWDDNLQTNVNPLGIQEGFFSASWDLKLRILRQLVEWQLGHNSDIRAKLDRAWGVKHNLHKKSIPVLEPPPPEDPASRQNLSLSPVGQDSTKMRYWVIDDSARLYKSSNPWKVACAFEACSSTLEEYLREIEKLQANAPPAREPGVKQSKFEIAHHNLIELLQSRVEVIVVADEARDKERKRLQREQLAVAQAAQIAATKGSRTRRQPLRPEYVYNGDASEDDGGDDYQFAEEEEEEDQDEFAGQSVLVDTDRGRRRSTRSTVVEKRQTDDPRVGRRSTRLAGQQDERPSKRRRVSSPPDSPLPEGGATDSLTSRVNKSSQRVVEAVPGKKKSKYWFYAVEGEGQSTGDGSGGPGSPARVAEDRSGTSMDGDTGSTAANGRRVHSEASSEPTSMDEGSDYEK